MKTWVRFTINGAAKGVVAETFRHPENPHALFLPEWAWIEAPAEAVPGSTFNGAKWTHPEPAPSPAPEATYRTSLSPAEFRNLFSAYEEVALVEFAEARPDGEAAETTTARKVVGVFFDRVRDPHLKTVDLADPRNLAGLDLLVSVGILSADRRAMIAKGMRG